MSSLRIGVLTSGGDCPGLNAVLRAVVASAHNMGWEVLGFVDGYEGLLCPVRYRFMTPQNTNGIQAHGGTILGTTNRGRFAAKIKQGEKAKIPPEVIDEAKATLEGLGVDALICIGGDGSLSTAEQMMEAGIKVVGVPKTIDNDLSATAMTFGFDSAVQCVVDCLDRLHTTATSHRRVMVVETMGRHAGWIALYGGLAGGADAILIPEIPFHYQKVADFVRNRFSEGALACMIVVAEGASPAGGELMTKEGGGSETLLGGIGHQVAIEIGARTGRETRAMVVGHLQRGGAPTSLDRILGTRFGVGAIDLIKRGKFGMMVSYQNYQVGAVTISEAVGQLKTVQPDSQLVSAAREVGIHFGD
jgi:ATP-dependent phosphofructokinase / diphosphate-dependent phosphofructokinase